MDWNKVGAIGSVGSFVLGLALFVAQVWPYPQWKAEHSQTTAVTTPQTQAKPVVPPPLPVVPKSIVFFLIASLLLASLSIWGAWRPQAAPHKLAIRSAFYGTGPLDDKDVTDRLLAAPRDALAIPVDNNFLGCDPAPMKTKRLQVEYSYGNLSVLRATRLEGGRLVLPEDSEVQRLAADIDTAKHQLAIATLPKAQPVTVATLQSRVLSLCGELRSFLKDRGPEPKIEKQPSEEFQDYMDRFRSTVLSWRTQFQASYKLKLGDQVSLIWDEIRAKCGTWDSSLDNAIKVAANSPNGEVKAVQEITERLWRLALYLD